MTKKKSTTPKAPRKAAGDVTITLTVPAAQATRAAKAIGRKLGLRDPVNNAIPRDATVGEVKQYLSDFLRISVREVEDAVARETAVATVTDIAIS